MRIQLWQAGMAVALAGASANAQIRITQSLEPDFVDPGSIACATGGMGVPQRTVENSYYRTYDLSQFPAVTGPFHITSVEVGVELALHPNTEQDVIVNLWVDCNGGEPLLADLTLIGTTTFLMIDTQLFVEIIPIEAVVCNDATLVVEVNTPNYARLRETAVFFMGSNAIGQNSPSYIRAPGCGFTEITDIADPVVGGGFPDMHIVLNVLGDIVAQCDDPCASCPCACDFDPDPACNIFDFLAFQTQFVAGCP